MKILIFLFFCSPYIFSNSIDVKCDSSIIAKIDSELFKKLDGEYYQITKVKDKELLFVYLNGMVNKCGVLLKKDEKSNIYNQYFSTHEICNFKIINNIVISSYKDKGKWFYKYFQVVNNILLSIEKDKLKLTPKNLTTYNNIAYYLQKAGANEEAVYLLGKILEKFPKRIVAYYNIGDAYWELEEKQKAIKAYTTYIEQMCDNGNQKKIPQTILERVKNK